MKRKAEDLVRYAEMLNALGSEVRLRIMRTLLSAHPAGLVAGDIQRQVDISASNLSHHLEKLKYDDLVEVRRDGPFLWYSANGGTLEELLGFLYAECCQRNHVLNPKAIVKLRV